MSFDFSWAWFADVLGGFCLILGSVFIFIAAIGMLRYPDLLSRQHVATKPQVFSLMMFLLGVILLVRETAVTWTLLLVIAFQLVSSPISAHMLSRAGYRTGRVLPQELLLDELGEDLRSGTDEYLTDPAQSVGTKFTELQLDRLIRKKRSEFSRENSRHDRLQREESAEKDGQQEGLPQETLSQEWLRRGGLQKFAESSAASSQQSPRK